jgi:hypothetical protein
MNLANQFNPCTKESQLHRVRIKPTQKQMGDISAKVDKEVKERSGGICERCRAARATERAHLIGRRHINHKTTAKDIWHLCTACHYWLDETPEGIIHKRKLREGA